MTTAPRIALYSSGGRRESPDAPHGQRDMPEKVLFDPYIRRMERLFPPEQMERLESFAEIVWGRDEPPPPEVVEAAREELVAIVTGGWRYGDVSRFARLRAILEVGGGFPARDRLDYDFCFSHGIRVLSCAPGFAPA